MFMTSDNGFETALRLNRSKYSKNIIFSYLNINSIRNKFDSVWVAIVNYVHISIAAETKINESFRTAQFAIDGFHKPLRLDATDKSGGLLVYVRSYLPLPQLTKHEISSDIQALVFEINLRKEKWFFLSICKSPLQNCQYFLDSLHDIIDFYSGVYGNHIVLGDFNMDPSHTQLSAFMEHYNYYSLIKSNACFKGDGSCIDFILTSRKYCFKNTSSFETGISDHHHLIYSMLKTTFEKEESKKVTYCNYKQFQWENLEKDLTSSLRNCNGE